LNPIPEKIPDKPDHPGYSQLQVRLHWAVVGLLALQWAASGVMKETLEALQAGKAPGALQFLLSSVHAYGGMTVFILVGVRFRLRWVYGPPFRRLSGLSAFGHFASAVHMGFYLILLIMPVTGSLAYYEVWPAAARWHHSLSQVLLLLIFIHVGAALVHYLVFKDGVAQRMFRWKRP